MGYAKAGRERKEGNLEEGQDKGGSSKGGGAPFTGRFLNCIIVSITILLSFTNILKLFLNSRIKAVAMLNRELYKVAFIWTYLLDSYMNNNVNNTKYKNQNYNIKTQMTLSIMCSMIFHFYKEMISPQEESSYLMAT